jgi:hypothetical protein
MNQLLTISTTKSIFLCALASVAQAELMPGKLTSQQTKQTEPFRGQRDNQHYQGYNNRGGQWDNQRYQEYNSVCRYDNNGYGYNRGWNDQPAYSYGNQGYPCPEEYYSQYRPDYPVYSGRQFNFYPNPNSEYYNGRNPYGYKQYKEGLSGSSYRSESAFQSGYSAASDKQVTHSSSDKASQSSPKRDN